METLNRFSSPEEKNGDDGCRDEWVVGKGRDISADKDSSLLWSVDMKDGRVEGAKLNDCHRSR